MLEVYVDGAASGNPGPSGAGVVIKNKQQFISHQFYLGVLSNHEAEIFAVIKALEICKKEFPHEILSIRSDSKLVVDMIEKEHTKNSVFQPLLKQILTDMQAFPHCFIKWIPDNQNKNADKLAREIILLHKDKLT
ncbi:ribonuclease H [Paraliobacillus quinghaiensis]|uniref:Ribonuclease H n=1 Tax=Paraliobacillus quinghaiensis TaxID=470815 RepID=A0A917WRG1_9BACI|nr:reverse transcriptase-like protein [Paraliobacillus quinghaiensis]GGM23230.1 ribonuclease H [Paraliobacillus quinghaiensis]